MGKLVLRDAGAIVPNGDNGPLPLLMNGTVDALAASAMLGSVIHNVAEDLPEPLRIRVYGGKLLFAVYICKFNTVLSKEFPVGIDRILKFRLQIQRFDG